MDTRRKVCAAARFLSLLIAACLTLGFLPAANAAESGSAALLETMTTEEKISQMILPAILARFDKQ